LNSNPPQGYRYAAGAYLAVFNRTKFIRLDNLFDCCRESLRTMDRAGLAAVDSTIAPFPAGSATLPQRVITPRLEARAEELRTTSAKLLALASGRVTLVHFWASWCGPCRREQPILDQLASKLQDRGLAVVGVNVDTAQPIQQQFEIGTLPVTLVFNRAGDLVTRLTGEQSESDFLRALEPLLLP
jgi:thioredoxin 1